jgi:hypothetical protein
VSPNASPSVAEGAQSIRVTLDIMFGGVSPCPGAPPQPYGQPVRFDLDLGTREIIHYEPRCTGDPAAPDFSKRLAWDFADVGRRVVTEDELASVVGILGGLHEGPRPLPCAVDGPQIAVDVARSAGTTTYQDGDTNCYDKPDVKYVDASLGPLLAQLRALAP